MSEWIVRDTNRDNERTANSKSDAQDIKNDLVSLGASPADIEIEPPETNSHVEAEIAENGKASMNTRQAQMPEKPPQVDEDPVEWMPDHFIDHIQGVPTVNRKGYAVIASQYGVSVEAEPVVRASETNFEYAEFRAVARTQDSEVYSGFGSAHVDRMDGDDPYLLNELAETRAMKRAVSWASGVGMTAISEMQGDLNE